MSRIVSLSAAFVCVIAAGLQAEVTLVGQSRAVTATATFDGTAQTAAAVGFEPLVAVVTAATEFPTAGGNAGNNTAVASINCLVDPNAITASGSLSSTGGFAVAGGAPAEVFGEAAAAILVTFDVATPTVFRLTALPRPTGDDEFEIELEPVQGDAVFHIDRHDAPRSVDETGLLAPGRYQFQYNVEVIAGAVAAEAQYGASLTLSSPCGAADIGRAGGLEGWDGALRNDDFIVFIDRYFTQNMQADIGQAGGTAGSDGLLDNNDFIAFIGFFFAADGSCY